MDNLDKPFLVARSCTEITSKPQLPVVGLLQAFRDHAAYVLLGEPGAGKTTAFRQEADSVGGEYITARDFCAIGPASDEKDQILFIDGLDEMRAGASDGNSPLDQIRQRLKKLNTPRFRLSCREADWLGASDTQALIKVSPDQKILALYLNPLTEQDVTRILQHNAPEVNAAEFVEQAQKHGLVALLDTPQTLHLLVKAVAGNGQQWPQSRSQVYEMACRQLIRELNSEHRHAKSANTVSDESLLESAGYLCAVQLLSGVAGFALDDDAVSAQYVRFSELVNPDKLSLRAALKTQLFQGTGDGAERRIPIHRSVAEYLGARYIAQSIHTRALPIGRVIALMTGEDGGVVPDLRGLMAWLALHCQTARAQLIDCDALGVVLYGDVKGFSPEDKMRILNGLQVEAQSNPWFRSGDNAHRFGALVSSDMEPVFRQMLTSPSRTAADQALLACILEGIEYGAPMQTLMEALDSIIRDASYDCAVREAAITARMNGRNDDDDAYWLNIADDIQAGVIADDTDELLGMLLRALYPKVISPEKVLNYFHRQKKQYLIGLYRLFWQSEWLNLTPLDCLPTLLDQFALRKDLIAPVLFDERHEHMLGEILQRGIVTYGDTVADERLYAWLSIGLNKDFESHIETTNARVIAQWFEQRPARFKSILTYGATLCHEQPDSEFCLHYYSACFYGASPPDDMVDNVRSTERLRQERAIVVKKIEAARQERVIAANKAKTAQQEQAKEWTRQFQQHQASIRDGSAQPGIFHQLTLIYKGTLHGAYGTCPHERLNNFFADDNDMVATVHDGFRNTLIRKDLPSASEIIEFAAKGREHRIRAACLIGMAELYLVDPTKALQLDTTILAALIAFHLIDNNSDVPAWFAALLNERADLVARVMVPYVLAILRTNKDHVAMANAIAYRDTFAKLAPLVLPDILEGFPLRARKDQVSNTLDPLLKGALHYLDKEEIMRLILRKMPLKSMDSRQKVYWFACALLTQPGSYDAKLNQYIGESEVRLQTLAEFLLPHTSRLTPDLSILPTSTMTLLIERLAAVFPPEWPSGVFFVTPALETSSQVRAMINALSADPDSSATQALEHLLSLPKLASWHTTLRGALHAQRITRRKASFKPVTSVEVSRMLANLQPANAADLAALVADHLRDIAGKIRDGNTNDYQQYWSLDSKNKNHVLPKPENDCRNALLSDLRARLEKLGIDAQPEGSYADNKRADIRISFNSAERSLNVPIEIKKDSHSDLWSAIHNQLIPRYVRDPGTEGQGIYLVFWFGGKGMPLPADAKRPKSAKELEERLRGLLTAEERHHIHICVIDCALHPTEKNK